jgi:predicted PurR-regulated permease PerM
MMEDGEGDLDERLGIQNPRNANNENGTNFNRALQKAASHMENTFVAAFAGIILAVVLLRDSATYASQIRALMPQRKFDTMAFILKKFSVFLQMSVC